MPAPGRTLVAALLCAALLASPASAATTLTVNSTADVAANFGACGNAATTTAPATLSLREAVCLANNIGGTVTVNIPAGTFRLSNGELQVGKTSGQNVSLVGASTASTIIDGQGLSRVIDYDPSIVGGVAGSVSNLTITNGKVTTFGGAGIIAGSGTKTTPDTLTVDSVAFSGNVINSTATNKYGAGLLFQGGTLSVTNSSFTSNDAGGGAGSGLAYTGEGTATEDLTVDNTTFSGNTGTDSTANIRRGGALYIENGNATPSVTNSRFTNNTWTATNGTAVGAAIYKASTGTLTLTGNTFSGNTVTSSGSGTKSGAAIATDFGSATLRYNRFAGNNTPTLDAISIFTSAIPTATIDADLNWWGCNSGPGNTGCDGISSGVTATKWLKLTASASPSTLTGPNATSTVSAKLTTDSNGGTVAGSNLGAFAGANVTWSDPTPSGATLSTTSSAFASGIATTTYNSQSTSGSGHVVATLDSATVTASLSTTVPPTITSADNATFTEGVAGTFSVTGSQSPTFSKTGSLPSGVTLASDGSLSGTPAAGTRGSYTITITATNGSGSATQSFTLTVNPAPAITSADHTTFTVGSAGTFSVTTRGTPTPTLTKSGALPSGVTLASDGTLSGTPAAGTGGSYPITITASNGVGADDTQSFTLTVNQAPAITSADHTSFTVGSSGSFTVTKSGYPAPTLSETGSLPSGISWSAGTLSGTPGAGTAGSYPITITASNGVGSDATQSFTITVNQAPAITSADHASFIAGSAGSFSATATGSPAPTFSKTGALPSGVSLASDGTLSGTPTAGSGGSYPITVKASNSVGADATQSFTLTVSEAPAITSADHSIFVEGAGSTFTVIASGYPKPVLSKSGSLPSGVTLTDNGDGTASLAGTPDAASAGDYSFDISATSGSSTATQSFTLVVNRRPAVTSASSATFTAGSAASFTVTASGRPTPAITKTGTLPSGISFTDNGDGTATVGGTPGAGSGGSYPLTVGVANSAGSDTQALTLVVDEAPGISSTDHASFGAGAVGSFSVIASGYPAPSISVAGSLPAGVSFTDNGNGTASLAGTPGAGSGGAYPLTVTSANGIGSDASQDFTLTVTEAPAITSTDHATFVVGTAGSRTISTTGYPASAIAASGSLPSGVSLDDNGDGTATLSGTPATGSSGDYPLTITATNPTTSASQSFTLVVDQDPAVTSVAQAVFVADTPASFDITASGRPTPALSATGGLPTGLTFTDNGDGTATLAGTPAAAAAGSYPITVAAANSVSTANQSLTVIVATAPHVTSSSSTTFEGGTTRTFVVTTTGSPAPALSHTGALPSGLSFVDNGNGTASISGNYSGSSEADFPIVVHATNAAGSDDQTLTIRAKPAALGLGGPAGVAWIYPPNTDVAPLHVDGGLSDGQSPPGDTASPLPPAGGSDSAALPAASRCQGSVRITVKAKTSRRVKVIATVVRVNGRPVRRLGPGRSRFTLVFRQARRTKARLSITAFAVGQHKFSGGRRLTICGPGLASRRVISMHLRRVVASWAPRS